MELLAPRVKLDLKDHKENKEYLEKWDLKETRVSKEFKDQKAIKAIPEMQEKWGLKDQSD